MQRPDSHSLHVLFVDDDPYVIESIRRMFHGMSGEWQMCFFSDPQAALEHARHNPCDVVVADIRMPDMDGFALLDGVRAHHPGAVCVLLSGDTLAADCLQCKERGYRLLEKPCTSGTLKTTIATALGDRARQETP